MVRILAVLVLCLGGWVWADDSPPAPLKTWDSPGVSELTQDPLPHFSEMSALVAKGNGGDAQACFLVGLMNLDPPKPTTQEEAQTVAMAEALGSGADYGAAFVWFCKAADLNHPKAEFCLGHMYDKGLYVGPNQDQATYWFKKAAAQNNPDAIKELKLIEALGPDTTPAPADAPKAIVIKVTTSQMCYVQIDTIGNYGIADHLFASFLTPDDKPVEVSSPLLMRVVLGNPGATTMLVDGKKMNVGSGKTPVTFNLPLDAKGIHPTD